MDGQTVEEVDLANKVFALDDGIFLTFQGNFVSEASNHGFKKLLLSYQKLFMSHFLVYFFLEDLARLALEVLITGD